MKKVRKILFMFSLLVSMLSFPAFADDITPETFNYRGIIDVPFAYQDRRTSRQGGTGVALAEGITALYMNPANLAEHKWFTMNLPAFNIGVYGLTKLMQNATTKEIILEAIHAGSFDPIMNRLAEFAIAVMRNYTYISAPFFDAQADIGFTAGGFGLDVSANTKVYTYNLDGAAGKTQIVPTVSFAARAGFATKFKLNSSSNISLGFSAGVVERIISQGIGLSDFDGSDPNADPMEKINSKPIVAGTQYPIHIGMNLNLMKNTFRASVLYKGIFDTKLYNYGSVSDFLSNIFIGFGAPTDDMVNIPLKGSHTIDFGFAVNPKWNWFNPRFEVDFVDAFTWTADNMKDNFFYHLKFGAEISLLEFIRVGAGYDQGRLTFGARIDLFPIVIDLDYGWIESTPVFGEAPIDYLSAQIKIGWDRTK